MVKEVWKGLETWKFAEGGGYYWSPSPPQCSRLKEKGQTAQGYETQWNKQTKTDMNGKQNWVKPMIALCTHSCLARQITWPKKYPACKFFVSNIFMWWCPLLASDQQCSYLKAAETNCGLVTCHRFLTFPLLCCVLQGWQGPLAHWSLGSSASGALVAAWGKTGRKVRVVISSLLCLRPCLWLHCIR